MKTVDELITAENERHRQAVKDENSLFFMGCFGYLALVAAVLLPTLLHACAGVH